MSRKLVWLIGLIVQLSLNAAGWQVLDFEQAFPQSKIEQLIKILSEVSFGLDVAGSGDGPVWQLVIWQKLERVNQLVAELQIDLVWPDDLSYLIRLLQGLQARFEQLLKQPTSLADLILQQFKQAQAALIVPTNQC